MQNKRATGNHRSLVIISLLAQPGYGVEVGGAEVAEGAGAEVEDGGGAVIIAPAVAVAPLVGAGPPADVGPGVGVGVEGGLNRGSADKFQVGSICRSLIWIQHGVWYIGSRTMTQPGMDAFPSSSSCVPILMALTTV